MLFWLSKIEGGSGLVYGMDRLCFVVSKWLRAGSRLVQASIDRGMRHLVVIALWRKGLRWFLEVATRVHLSMGARRQEGGNAHRR